MSAKHSLVDFRWRFIRQLEKIDESVAVVAVQTEHVLLAGHRHLVKKNHFIFNCAELVYARFGVNNARTRWS